VWAWRRGEHALVAINMSDRDVALDGFHGRLLIGTEPKRVGEKLAGTIRLGAWEAVIAEVQAASAAGSALAPATS
jgi:hypothetical protein